MKSKLAIVADDREAASAVSRKLAWSTAVVLLALAVGATTSLAAALGKDAAFEYPSRAVHMVVPFPPAGATDILACLVGKRLTEVWDQNVISGEH